MAVCLVPTWLSIVSFAVCIILCLGTPERILVPGTWFELEQWPFPLSNGYMRSNLLLRYTG